MSQHATIKAGIIGGAGYTGGELLRLLLRHPLTEVSFVHSRSQAGQPVHSVHSDLLGDTDLHFTDRIDENIQVLFLCVGHGEARAFLERIPLPDTIRVIDLSQDFRLKQNDADRTFVYGLPECNKEAIQAAANIANPGCFATAIQLALLPLASKGLLQNVHATGITGATGAGQKLQESAHFSWRSGNIQAYKTLTHQHLHEIRQTLGTRQPNVPDIFFVPWRGDFTRGIYVSAHMTCDLDLNAAYDLYERYYADAAFTHVSRQMIDLKQVVNTNKCLLHLGKEGTQLIVHAAIDNLLKGASGQAVQNMNLLYGWPEDTGLRLKATAF